jgi:hypothetical protein
MGLRDSGTISLGEILRRTEFIPFPAIAGEQFGRSTE